jgi:hypothetical protein
VHIDLYYGTGKCTSQNDGAVVPYATTGANWTAIKKHPVIGLECKKAKNRNNTMCQVAGELLTMLHQRKNLLGGGVLNDSERVAIALLIENFTIRFITMYPSNDQLKAFRDGKVAPRNQPIQVHVLFAYSLGDDQHRQDILAYMTWILDSVTDPKGWLSRLGRI